MINPKSNVTPFLLVCLLWVWLSAGCCVLVVAAENHATVTVTPRISEKLVLNPGKGWVIYGGPDRVSPEILAIGGIGYSRFHWADIEPEEGRYNWSSIDEAITRWAARGKPCAFGVMSASTHSRNMYVTPKWVFDAGVPMGQLDLQNIKMETTGIRGIHTYPKEWDHPVYLAKLRNFIQAMAARYDGNPHVPFIDMRSYGNWGEGHLSPFGGTELTPDALKNHLQMYLDAFRKTRICVPWGQKKFNDIYDWAARQGMAIRRDGICGNSDGIETARTFGYAPGVFEFFGSYRMMKGLGWWDGIKDKNGYGHRLIDCFENGKPSYMGLGSGADEMIREERQLIESLANRMGYHFILNRAEFPSALSVGSDATVLLQWENRGIAPIYIPCFVSLGLLDKDGKTVAQCWPSQSDPKSWHPGNIISEETVCRFNRVQSGRYRLAVGLFHAAGDTQPAFELGVDLPREQGWYVLGEVEVRD